MQDQQDVAIDQGTVSEVIEGRTWWKVCLGGCAILLVLTLIVGLFLARALFGSGPERVSVLPEGFPSDFALYRPEEVREIYYLPGSSKEKTFRFMTVPLRFMSSMFDEQENLPNFEAERGMIAGRTDTVSMMWEDVQADEDDVLKFYAGSLKQAGVANPEMRRSEDRVTSEMIGSASDMNFSLLLVNEPDTDVIDTLTIIVEYQSPDHQGE